MTLNPKLSQNQSTLGLIIAMLLGLWVISLPEISRKKMMTWVDKHKVEWNTVKNSDPSCSQIRLISGTARNGTAIMIGYAYDNASKNKATKFALDRKPPGNKFETWVQVVPLEVFTGIQQQDNSKETASQTQDNLSH